MNFRIRKATTKDVEICARIHIQAWQESYRGIIPDSHLDSIDFQKRVSLWSKLWRDRWNISS